MQPDHSARPLALTVLLAVAFLTFGLLRPALNFDLIPYAALAKELRGAGGRQEAYQELAAKVGPARFQSFITTPYRERMYADAAFFERNLPFYRIRPLYIWLCSPIGWLIGSDVAATYVISAFATALAVVVSYGIARNLGARPNSELYSVPLSWLLAGGLGLAQLSTPDALETALSLLFVLFSAKGLPVGWRAVPMAGLAALMVAARTDAVVLLACLLAVEWILRPRSRLAAALIAITAVGTYVVIGKWTGTYGYFAVLNFTLIDNINSAIVPRSTPDLVGYGHAFVGGILQILGGSDSLYGVSLALLAIAGAREWRAHGAPGTTAGGKGVYLLSVALGLFLILHFVLFPVAWMRHLIVAYVLSGVLFARAIQWRSGLARA